MTATTAEAAALNRLAARASVREFACAPTPWDWEWRHAGIVVTFDLHDEPKRLVVDGEDVDVEEIRTALRARIRHAHAEVGQDLMSVVGMAPEGVTVSAEDDQWTYSRGDAQVFSSDERLTGDPGILEDFRAAGWRWIFGLTIPAPVGAWRQWTPA